MCLETSIGLSQTVCNCFEDTPTDYNTSDSGYYLDELEGISLNMVNAMNDCENGNVWDILAKARTNAIQDFKGDLLTQIGSLNKKRIENITYNIGSQKYTTAYNAGKTYAGVRLVPRPINNGIIKINHIKLLFNSTVTVTCKIFNNLSSTALYTFNVNCTANMASQSATLNYELPMYVSGEQIEYFLVYEYPVGAFPLQNKIVCSSCLKWDITCCEDPCFGNRIVKDQTWNNNLMIGGISGDDWTELDEQTGISNQNNGIIINLTMNCDYESLICGNIDYANGGLPMAIAKSIQLKAGALLCDYILSSGQINRYTMIDRERILQKKAEYIKDYQNRILWLSQNIDTKENGCYICEPTMRMSGIMA
jgi:hypothetical protein